MTNLLPPYAKKDVRREYTLRVISVSMILISIILLFGTLLLAAAYFVMRVDIALIKEDMLARGDVVISEEFNTARTALQDANVIAAQLGRGNVAVYRSDYIDEVFSAVTPGIRLQGLLFPSALTKEKKQVIEVQAIADSRQAVAQFVDSLRASERIENAVVPISELAEESDIHFTVTIILVDA